jgi:hypothetical protein
MPELQCELFKAALEFVSGNEPINSAIRVSWDNHSVTLEAFDLANEGSGE